MQRSDLPRLLAMAKALLGASATLVLAILFGEPLPSAGAALALPGGGVAGGVGQGW